MSMTGGQGDDLVLLGKITKPHGIRGEVKIYPYTEDPASFVQYRHLFLSRDGGGTTRSCTNIQARVQGNVVIVKLKECTSRTEAESLVGAEVLLRSEELPELDQGEFYLYTLEGKQAVSETGEDIGVIETFFTAGGQTNLIIKDQDQEYLVPLVAEFVVDIREGEVVLCLPPGLLDINK